MSTTSSIEWTESTWNPVRGCSRVSPGCEHCYAERQAHRFGAPGGPYEGLTRLSRKGPQWTGKIKLVYEALEEPLSWKRPRLVFVNSMSDLFHDKVPLDFIAVPSHLRGGFHGGFTCRLSDGVPSRARSPRRRHPSPIARAETTAERAGRVKGREAGDRRSRTLDAAEHSATVLLAMGAGENHHAACIRDHRLRCSVTIAAVFETMRRAHWHTFQVLTKRSERLAEVAHQLPWPRNVWMGVSVESQSYLPRVADLVKVPAAVRFLSLEPLIEALPDLELDGIHWVIVGGESGPGARPMDSEWVREIQAKCERAAVPFFFKQWGGINKKKAGRELDGREWNDMPASSGLCV